MKNGSARLQLIHALGPLALALLAFTTHLSTPPEAAAANGPATRAASRGDATLTLASNGKALLPIIISPRASARTQAVAAELAGYLNRITGAAFEVRTGDGSGGIILGTLADFPNPQLDRVLEIKGPYDGREAFAIRTEPKRLLLLGATDLGISHAAFRFLELVGCRWFFPAPEWEVVPSVPTLRFDLNENDRPTILARRIWYGYGFFREPADRGKPRAMVDYEAWARHNRMAGSFTVNAGHAWQTIIAEHKADFDNHPEYYALVKGERRGPQLCVSNPTVRKIATAHALDYLRKHPDADMVSMETSDGGGHCECAKCQKLGTISDRAFDLANEVSRAVAREFPGKMVGMYAYNDHCEPPSFDLEPNIYVQSTAGFISGRYTFEELMDLWPAKCRSMGFYEYFSVWLWDFDRLPGGRAADVYRSREQIRKYAARHATSLDAESGDNWGPHGRGYFVANRLMWNPETDVDALLSDFYDKAFGPAAAPMRRYYERLDPGNKPLMSRHLLALALRDVAEASQLAKERPDVLARLAYIKQYLHYIHLTWLLDREKDKAKRKELTLAAITHVYRTRFSYMNHWEAVRQSWATKAAKDFDEPSWSANARGPKPWTDAPPPTAQETERAFQEALAWFQPQMVEEKQFSADLVPVLFPPPPVAGKKQKPAGNAPPGPPASAQQYQGGLRYAFYSMAGEPIELEVTTGTIAWYRDRPDARYTLKSAGGQTVADDRIKLDGEKHPLTFKVPKTGLYYFDFNDSSAGWRISIAPGRPCSIPLLREKGFSHAGHMQRMYFYVPKGTRHIDYYWHGGPHKVLDPAGHLVQEMQSSGEFVSLTVPEGADGHVWSFSQLALGHLWFFNLPNQLAASPEALLIPREVAQHDGLDVRQR